MKILKITWLDACNKCGFDEYANVHTEKGHEKLLYEGDAVYCPRCFHDGEIESDMNCAYVQWFEFNEDRAKYNKLKQMYDMAVECLMESNYGDIRYLRVRGAIE